MKKATAQETRIVRFVLFLSDHKFPLMIYSIGVVHTLFLFLFLYLHVLPMVIFNVFSVLTYVTCGLMLRKPNQLFYVFLATYIEILLHSLAAAVCIGWQYGFTMYILALIPFCYYMCNNLVEGRKKYAVATLLGFIAFLAFAGCRMIILFRPPVYSLSLSPLFSFFVYMFNAISTCIFMIVFSLIFLLEIHISANKLHVQNELLERLANIDPLTGLYNRRSMQVFLDHATESGTEFYLAMCDIDDFKKVNDTYGHDAGDTVLKDIAAIMKQQTEGLGYVCRWGGEEILILSNVSADQTHTVMEKIRRSIANHIFVCGEKLIRCSVTIGIAAHKSGVSIEDTINTADYNLYRGKRTGKNKVVL